MSILHGIASIPPSPSRVFPYYVVQYIVQKEADMNAVSYSEARKRLKEYLDHETNYLLGTRANQNHLFASLENARKRELRQEDLEEE